MNLQEELYNTALDNCYENFKQDDIDCEKVLSQITEEVAVLTSNLERIFKELAKAGKTKAFIGLSISYEGQGLDYVWDADSPDFVEGFVEIEIRPLVSQDTGQWLLGNSQRAIKFAKYFGGYIKEWVSDKGLSVFEEVYFDAEEYVYGFGVSWVDINRNQLEEVFSQSGGYEALKEGVAVEDILA